MTKETKIGLLVGLAFIILFAIILSEKGSSPRSTSPPTYTLADSTMPESADTGSDQPLSDVGRLAVDSRLSPIIKPPSGVAVSLPLKEEEVVQQNHSADQPIPPLPESVVKLLNGASPPAKDQLTGEQQAASDQSGQVRTADVALTTTPQSEAQPAQHGPPAPTVMAGQDASTEAGLAERSSTPPAVKTIHVVQKGQSLGKIAAEHYGRSNATRVKAIFEANTDVLENMHTVRAGQKLKIPDLGEASSSFEAAPEFVVNRMANTPTPRTDNRVRIPIPISEKGGDLQGPASVASAAIDRQTAQQVKLTDTRATAAFQWYTVRPSDTLSSIARRQLGSDRFFSEIYRLNRDVIRDKNSIKPGMKIRLPRPRSSAESLTALSAGQFEDAEP